MSSIFPSIPQSYLNDTLGLKTGDSVRVAADNECRTERVESPSTETHCQLEMAGGNYEATFPNTDCDVTEEKVCKFFCCLISSNRWVSSSLSMHINSFSKLFVCILLCVKSWDDSVKCCFQQLYSQISFAVCKFDTKPEICIEFFK